MAEFLNQSGFILIFENPSKNRLTNHKEHVHGFYERPNTSRRRMSARQLLDEISDDQSGASTQSTNQNQLAADEDKENTSEENHKDNYCYVCNRQFENKTGFTVHMTRQHSHNSNNSNNSNNIEPSSKRFKGDGKSRCHPEEMIEFVTNKSYTLHHY